VDLGVPGVSQPLKSSANPQHQSIFQWKPQQEGDSEIQLTQIIVNNLQ
jgi:hypothetical protein